MAQLRHTVGDQPADVARAVVESCGLSDARRLLSKLVPFQTVASIAEPSENPAFAEMADSLERWAQAHGLEMHVFGAHDAWEVVLPGRDRDAPRSVLFVAHGDVVPVNDPPTLVEAASVPEGWTAPAFEVTERDEKLWGRGTEDDKGAIAAVLVGFAAMRAAGFVPAADVALAIGTAEEHAWDGMRRYAEQAPEARHVVCVDGRFPVVVAQSGFVAWGLRLPRSQEPARRGQPVVRHLEGGLFLTQVPGEATMVLEARGERIETLVRRARQAAEEELAARHGEASASSYRIDVHVENGHVRLTVHGRSVHSSTAEEGANALWPLASLAQRLDVAPGGFRTVLDILAQELDGDHYGKRLGLAYGDPTMGKLLVAATKLRTEEEEIVLEINMRRPHGMANEDFEARLGQTLSRLRREYGRALRPVEDPYVGAPHVADAEGPLVTTLLAIYGEMTGATAPEPSSMRGGTYARLFEDAVSFGPAFPEHPYRGHGADEYIRIDALEKLTPMYLEAVLRLAQ